MDRKVAMNSTAATYCNMFIHNLREKFPNAYILIIHGTLSHDWMQLDSFKHYVGEKFRLYKTFTVDFIEGMKLLIIPEEYYPDKSVYDSVLKIKNNEKYDFVFIHGLFNHVGNYATLEGNKKNKICFTYKDFEHNVYGRVNCGHIHIHNEYKNIDYNGSFSRWTHGEEEDKGFFTYIYNVNKHKLISKKFIVNDLAPLYITINYNDLPKNGKELYKTLKEYSEKVGSLRIAITPETEIDEAQLQELLLFVKDFNNIIIHKTKIKEVNDETLTSNESEYKEKVNKYLNKSFEEITIVYAKDELNKTITKDQIIEALS